MKQTVFLITILATVFFSNCSKKDLPQPDPLNASNTKIPQQTAGIPPLTAPCASSLIPNRITFINSQRGSGISFTPLVYSYNNIVDISCADYSYNEIRIYLPVESGFLGKKKYDVKSVSTPSSSVAILTHHYNSINYVSPSYFGYEGTIYAEYTSTKIIISFCGVKVKSDAGSIHYVTGQVIINNHF